MDSLNTVKAALLNQSREEQVRQLRVAPHQSNAGEIFIAIDASETFHLLVPSDGDHGNASPGVSAITWEERELIIEGRSQTLIDVSCNQSELQEVFDSFLESYLLTLSNIDVVPSTELRQMLLRWKAFFQSAKRLTSVAVVGLIGELFVLRLLVGSGGPEAMTAWVGPNGARHDFRRGECALEIKSTLSHTSRSVRVHGLDQLEVPSGGELFLALLRFEPVPNGELSAPELLDELIAAGCDKELLYDLCLTAGYSINSLTAASDLTFSYRGGEAFEVNDAFPRLTVQSFDGGIPDGVDDIDYSVDLSHASDSKVSDAEWERILKLVAGAGGS